METAFDQNPNRDSSVIRIFSSDDKDAISGCGFYLGGSLFITCAHVVNNALGKPEENSTQPVGKIFFDFPLLKTQPKNKQARLTAEIYQWFYDGQFPDIVILVCNIPIPANVCASHLLSNSYENLEKHDISVFGFPQGNDNPGGWHLGQILKKVGGGLYQITRKDGYAIQPGYSGSPVWDERSQNVVGIISQAQVKEQAGFMTPISMLTEAWPSFEGILNLQKAGDFYRFHQYTDFLSCIDLAEQSLLSDPEIQKIFFDALMKWGKGLYENGSIDVCKDVFQRVLKVDPENLDASTWVDKIEHLQQLYQEAQADYKSEKWQNAKEKLVIVINKCSGLIKAKNLQAEINDLDLGWEAFRSRRLEEAYRLSLSAIIINPESEKAFDLYRKVFGALTEDLLNTIVSTYLDLDLGDKPEDHLQIVEMLRKGFQILEKIPRDQLLISDGFISREAARVKQELEIISEILDERKNQNCFHDIHLYKQLLNFPAHRSRHELLYLQALIESELTKWINRPETYSLDALKDTFGNLLITPRENDHDFHQTDRLKSLITIVTTISNHKFGEALSGLERALWTYSESVLMKGLIKRIRIEVTRDLLRKYADSFSNGDYDRASHLLGQAHQLLLAEKEAIAPRTFKDLADQFDRSKYEVDVLIKAEAQSRKREFQEAAENIDKVRNNDYTNKVYYEVRYLQGEQLYQSQDWFKAFYAFKEVVTWNPFYKKAAQRLEECIIKRVNQLAHEDKYHEIGNELDVLPTVIAQKPEFQNLTSKIDFLNSSEEERIQTNKEEIRRLLSIEPSPSQLGEIDQKFTVELQKSATNLSSRLIDEKKYSQAVDLLNTSRAKYPENKEIGRLYSSTLFMYWLNKPGTKILLTFLAFAIPLTIAFGQWWFPDIRMLLFPPVQTATATSTITPNSSQTKTPFPSETASPTSTISPSPATLIITGCQSTVIPDVSIGNRFIRWEGVTSFAVENSPPGAILNNHVRSLLVNKNGVWIGYLTYDQAQTAGLSYFNHKIWEDCNSLSNLSKENINALLEDLQGRLWVATENGGLFQFDGKKWQNFKTTAGLPSDKIYGLTLDKNGSIWAATWEGIARFNESIQQWEVVYSAENGTLHNDHTHAIAFSENGDIWVGLILNGVDRFNNKNGSWEHFDSSPAGLCGEQIRRIALRVNPDNKNEEIWFASVDGGVCKYSAGLWTDYTLSSKVANDIKVDHLSRVWAATDAGIFYLENDSWQTYVTLASESIAFGVSCEDCPFSTDDILLGTKQYGLTHSGLPQSNMIEVLDACFVINGKRECDRIVEKSPGKLIIRPSSALSPGQEFVFELVVSPKSPYQLQKGDFLSFTLQDETYRYGAYILIPVNEVVLAGQRYVISNYNNPFIAPDVSSNESRNFTNMWRIWMSDRYTGPIIQLSFDVARPELIPTPSPTPNSTPTVTNTPAPP